MRIVVRRFGGKEGLLANAVETLAAQINAQRATSPGDVGCLVDNIIAAYNRTGDAVVRLLALEPRHAALKAFLYLFGGQFSPRLGGSCVCRAAPHARCRVCASVRSMRSSLSPISTSGNCCCLAEDGRKLAATDRHDTTFDPCEAF